MLAVGPLGPQYCCLFAWYELGRQAQLGRRHENELSLFTYTVQTGKYISENMEYL